jgi:FG-GAP-like repeat/RTX calcium-binding nonapeptide repeat (4 copies)
MSIKPDHRGSGKSRRNIQLAVAELLERRQLLDGLFSPQATYPAGTTPVAIAAGDFAHDGTMDLVTANEFSNNISVFMGNGDGTFQPQMTFAAGDRPYSVAVADLNGDGVPDLVVADETTPGYVSVLVGNGDGTFQPAQSFAAGANPFSVAVGDLNGDGKMDVVVANYASNNVGILFGNGNGTLKPEVTYSVGVSPSAVALADLSNNGIYDIVVTNKGSYSVGVLMGNGNGTFQQEVTYAVGNQPAALAVADLLNDGTLDLVVTNSSFDEETGTVSVLIGNGDGTFQPQLVYDVGSYPKGVAVGDFYGDGTAEIVVANTGGDTLTIITGAGEPTPDPQTETVGNYPQGLAVADFNNDGEPDLAVANSLDGTAGVLLNTAEFFPSVYSISPYPVVGSYSPQTITINGDGFLPGATVGFNVNNSGSTFYVGATFVSNTELQVNVTLGEIGAFDQNVEVTNPDGARGEYYYFTLYAPTPTISSIQPQSKNYGSGGFTLDVYGPNFNDYSTVYFNGTALSTNVIEGDGFIAGLSATVSSEYTSERGQDEITVVTPGPGGGTSNAVPFNVVAPTVDIDFTAGGNPQSGAGVAGYSGDIWNNENNPDFVLDNPININSTSTMYTDASGSPVILSFTAALANNIEGGSPAFGETPYSNLMSAYLIADPTDQSVNEPGPPGTVTLSGLTADAPYALVLYSGGDINNDETIFTINGSSPVSSLFDTSLDSFAQDVNYVVYEAVADSNGQIAITFDSVPGEEADLNGLQLSKLSNFLGEIGQQFDQQPTNVYEGSTMPPVTVDLEGSYGAVLTDVSGDTVTLSALLNGTVMATFTTTAVNGVATFNDIILPTPGSYVLTSNDPNIDFVAESNPFVVMASPTINNVSPATFTGSNNPQTLTFTGVNFAPGADVILFGPAGTLTLGATMVSASEVQAVTIFGNTGQVFTAEILDPGSQPSNTINFTVDAPAPVITSISPTSAFVGETPFVLTVDGTTFDTSSEIQFNGTVLSTTPIINGGVVTGLTATVPASDLTAAGTEMINVVTPGPGGGASSVAPLSITSAMPTITSINPSSVAAGGPDFLLTVMGDGFDASSAVQIDGTSVPTTDVLSGGAIVGLVGDIPAADIASAGTGSVTATNTSGTSTAVVLTISAPSMAPSITQSTNGTITITGNNTANTGSVTYSNGMVTVVLDGTTQTFTGTSTTGVNIVFTGGNNNLTIGAGVPSVTAQGGTGSDTIVADNSAGDSLNGGVGGDSIQGGSSKDTLMGGMGPDTISGGATGSMEMGGHGGDMILLGNDPTGITAVGGMGSDTIATSTGGDSLGGGLGSDIILNQSGGEDTINGGQGLNFAEYNPTDSETNIFEEFDPPAPADPPADPPSLLQQEAAESFIVKASVSNGTLVVVGTPANETISVTLVGNMVSVQATGYSVGTFPLSELTGVHIVGGTGDDKLKVGSTVLLPATIRGGSGDDTLVGGGGGNVLIAGEGNSVLHAGGGVNLLVPGKRIYFSDRFGRDTLIGGTGMSIADFSRRIDPLFLSNDNLPDSGDTAAGEAIEIMSNVSAIWGGTGNDTIVGTTPGEFLSGGAGNNTIHGGGTTDLLIGGDGQDTVVAAAEPVSLFLSTTQPGEYGGVNNPSEDVLQVNTNLDTLIAT